MEELALEASGQGGNIEGEGDSSRIRLWERDSEGGCGAALVGLVMEDT